MTIANDTLPANKKISQPYLNSAKIREKLHKVITDTPSIWKCDSNAQQVEKAYALPSNTTYANAIKEFNKAYVKYGELEGPQLVFRRWKNNLLIIRVKNNQVLSNNMGTTGAACFLATATYTLTSVLPHVDAVYFDIKTGSHATPGVYTRFSFIDMMPF